MTAHTPLVVIGYAPHENIIDREILADYRDFPVGMTMTVEEIIACLDRGVLPPGLLVYCDKGKPGKVIGAYHSKQIIEACR